MKNAANLLRKALGGQFPDMLAEKLDGWILGCGRIKQQSNSNWYRGSMFYYSKFEIIGAESSFYLLIPTFTMVLFLPTQSVHQP